MAKTEIEALIKAGAFDFLQRNRGQLFEAVKSEQARAASWSKIVVKDTWTLFEEDNGSKSIPEPTEYPNATWTQEQYKEFENEVLEYYLSGHPFDSYENLLKIICNTDIKSIDPTAKRIVLYAILRNIKIVQIKSGKNQGKKMFKCSLEDRSGRITASAFTETYDKYNKVLEKDSKLIIVGSVSNRTEILEVIIRDVCTLEEYIETKVNSILLKIDSQSNLQKIRQCLDNHIGKHKIYLQVDTVTLETEHMMAVSENSVKELFQHLPLSSIYLRYN